ncbi:speckle-type POZ protein [Caerostris extrusa]|uniref:Speckle-type POZ protein n=1 Tax=Caerostris extrusa TaxID=172846 RepID=A0AAV4QHR9_CAEEX|nr:speckle-type POZ protein [Caerostris extrusa]
MSLLFDGSFPLIEETESISSEKGNEIKIIRELRDTFLNRPRILSNGDTLTICCEIWKHCRDNIAIKSSSVIDNKSLFGEDFQAVYEEVSRISQGISKIQDLNPVKFYAKTQMQVERKTFVYLVKDSSILQKPHNESFTIHSTSDLTPPLLLTINFSEHLSKTEFYILISDGHLFNPSETLVWRIAIGNWNFPTEQKLDLNFSDEELSLRFELDICNGTEISSIEKVIYATRKG